MILEICANSFESAQIAEKAGAHRIELCTELSVGGLTPSFGLLEKVLTELTIPVHVLIRPRSGNFTYSEIELDVMLRDIETCKEFGCDGIVSGALLTTNTIDIPATKRLIAASGNMEFTFHRAFDWCKDPMDALEHLKQMGVTRLLSSGQKPTAIAGIDCLKNLLEKSGDRLQIMPGGGISTDNCMLFNEAGFDMIHFSATKKVQTLHHKPVVTMQSAELLEEGIVATSNEASIREINEKLNG